MGDYSKDINLRSCFTSENMIRNATCCSSRTFVQTQSNKAVRSAEKLFGGDHNPKDHILFDASQYSVLKCDRDNTGERRYIERACFPALQFPSDHAIVSV